MAKSTGPMLALGAITFTNKWIGNNQGPDFKILLGTGIATVMLAGAEKISQPIAVGIAWIALITSLLVKPKVGNSAVDNLTKMTGF